MADIQAQKKILIIDDTDHLRITLKIRLEKMGFQVYTAMDGQEALTLMNTNKVLPDLILSDVMMPKVDGLVFLHTIKSQARFKEIPVIMLTAKGEKKDILSALQAGASDYIVKPFDGNILVEKIKTLFMKKTKDEELKRMEQLKSISLDDIIQ